MGQAPLVSVIIPCYNAERWVAEAIDSCLAQTYRPLEIIVIDDGSTDRSLEIIESYGPRIRHESGENKGGNHARNRGFSLSNGKYIQFLDADDYILPEKIESQVRFLEDTKADVVYGDWRHRLHLPDGSSELDAIHVSNEQSDILESLLTSWWVASLALLFERQSVLSSGGWDEGLGAAQDTDFFHSIVLSGADVRYQPGCHSIYRRYGNVTVSTSSRSRWLQNRCIAYDKVENALAQSGRLTQSYRRALAQTYFSIARTYYDIDRELFTKYLKKTLTLYPEFKPHESLWYNTSQRLLGFHLAEWLASIKRRRRNHVRTYEE